MAIRDKIQAKAAPQLQPGEQVQAVFAAQTASQWLIVLLGVVFLAMNEYRCVVVTDRRIVVFNSGKLSQANPKEIVYELPRGTIIGPPSGLWHPVEAHGETVRIHKRFHKDVVAADSLAGAAAA